MCPVRCVTYVSGRSIASKYAAILTFTLSGNMRQKTNLPTICQLLEQPNNYTAGLPVTVIGSGCVSPKPE
jgi:hypothetical protein